MRQIPLSSDELDFKEFELFPDGIVRNAYGAQVVEQLPLRDGVLEVFDLTDGTRQVRVEQGGNELEFAFRDGQWFQNIYASATQVGSGISPDVDSDAKWIPIKSELQQLGDFCADLLLVLCADGTVRQPESLEIYEGPAYFGGFVYTVSDMVNDTRTLIIRRGKKKTLQYVFKDGQWHVDQNLLAHPPKPDRDLLTLLGIPLTIISFWALMVWVSPDFDFGKNIQDGFTIGEFSPGDSLLLASTLGLAFGLLFLTPSRFRMPVFVVLLIAGGVGSFYFPTTPGSYTHSLKHIVDDRYHLNQSHVPEGDFLEIETDNGWISGSFEIQSHKPVLVTDGQVIELDENSRLRRDHERQKNREEHRKRWCLKLRNDHDAYRHYLVEKPVRQGDVLELKTDAGWIRGRYQWSYHPRHNPDSDLRPYLETSDSPYNRIDKFSEVRWPEEGEPDE